MLNPTPAVSPCYPGLSRRQRLGLVALVAGFVLFGLLVEFRSAFLKRHMTDFQVYLRAAWAVRTGNDFYAVQDDNHWHYHYPPLFAIVLMPLADAPKGAEPLTAAVPFAVSVAVWYAFSLVCLAAAVHWLATALEETAAAADRPVPPRGCRRWWALRVLPVLACLAPIGGTLGRGQVNLLLLALLCGMTAAALRRQSWRAGLWLAAAVCLKVIPAFLLIYPLWRRDWRWLGGAGLGLALGLFVVPAVVMGPARAVASYREWADVLARPALGTGHDHSRDVELIGATATDSQSFEILLHNLQHFDRRTRVYFQEPAPEVRVAHWLIGGALTVLTLLAAGWKRAGPLPTVLGLGSLTLIMVLLSPVCHLHYFCVAVPLVMGLIWRRWERSREGETRLGWGLALLLVVNGLASALPHLPGLEVLRDVGSATCGTLLLWLTAMVVLVRQRREPPARTTPQLRAPLGTAA